ncbi:MAG: CoA-transferase [Thermoleophilia bacterium]|nr:CoA-transferase [Thermoleophilia bacterium]
MTIARHEICAVALADAFRGDGEILASGIGVLPSIAARLARATFAPDLMLTDGVATLVEADGTPSGWMPYRAIFDLVWSGRRHVIMGASQIDRFGNQNIAAIGDPRRPKAQLLGMRGAPGNTINHPTSYWIPSHSRRSFVEKVDVVSGVGYDRAAALGSAARFHEIRRVVTDLAVLDFQAADHAMRLVSLHPGVTLATVVEKTGFALGNAGAGASAPETRVPTDEELDLLRRVIDPHGLGAKEIAS